MKRCDHNLWTALVLICEDVLRINLADARGMIIPIPGVEYTDVSVDLALDGRLVRMSLAGEEDSVHVKPSSEFTIMRFANIHVEGFLASEHREVGSSDEFGYLRYKPLLGYGDEGVVGVATRV